MKIYPDEPPSDLPPSRNTSSESEKSISHIGRVAMEWVRNLLTRAVVAPLETSYDRAFRDFPKEKFHYLYIDLDRVLLGPLCFDEKEPGYAQGMEEAFAYIRETIGRPFGQEELNALHTRCIQHIPKLAKVIDYRDGPTSYGLKEKFTPEAKAELSSIPIPFLPEFVQDLISPPSGLFVYAYPVQGWMMTHGGLPKGDLQIIVNFFFEDYSKQIRSASSDAEKLRAIVTLCRSLEVLHPFTDGNQRTIAFALLTKLLIENGFSPAILKDPTMFDGDWALNYGRGDVLTKLFQTELYGLLSDEERARGQDLIDKW